MQTLTLEFSKLQLTTRKERWRLYFILVAEHPEDNDKRIITTFPDPFIRLKPNQDNLIRFEPEGSQGTDGLFVIERPMPADRRIKVKVYLRQSKKSIRSLGEALQDLNTTLGGDAFEVGTELLGATQPWLVVAQKAVPMIGTALAKIKDRDMGFVSMDESFDEETGSHHLLERANNFSTGEAKIWWKWKITDWAEKP